MTILDRFSILLIALLSMAFLAPAWMPHTTHPSRSSPLLLAVKKQSSSSEQETALRRDIAASRQAAQERLQGLRRLEAEMVREWDDLQQQQQEQKEEETEDSVTPAVAVVKEVKAEEHQVKAQEAEAQASSSPVYYEEPETTVRDSTTTTTKEAMAVLPDLNLLTGTSWRVAYDIGREAGTWMPAEWAASGSRMRFSLIVTFTNESVRLQDDFFCPRHDTKVCRVTAAWLPPTLDKGQQPLPVRETGVYQVARGQGPAGTDVLRFALDLKEPLMRDPDVSLPAGKIYATCGYHGQNGPVGYKKYLGLLTEQRERAQKAHDRAVGVWEELNQRLENSDWWEHAKTMKTKWETAAMVSEAAQVVRKTQLRAPNRSALRFSRDENVALAKEGNGVCGRVHKGLSIEYRILGTMEMASVEIENDDDDDDNQEETENPLASASDIKTETRKGDKPSNLHP